MSDFKIQFYCNGLSLKILLFSIFLNVLLGSKPIIAANQMVSLEPQDLTCNLGDKIQIKSIYSTSDDSKTFGLGVRFHFDSSKLEFIGFSDILQSPPIANESIPTYDFENFDEDASTDQFVLLSWFAFSESFPYTTMPTTLALVAFFAISQGDTSINVSFKLLADGYSGKSSNATITILPPPPELINCSPHSGITAGGENVKILGLNFTSEIRIFFGEKEVYEINVVSSTEIVCKTPPHRSGIVDITLKQGNYVSSLPGYFEYVPPTSLSYISGQVFPCNEELISNTNIYTWNYGQIYGQAKLLPECYFFMTHMPGTFTLNIFSEGYLPYVQNIEVPEYQAVEVNVLLQKEIHKIHLKDVIQLMKYLSR